MWFGFAQKIQQETNIDVEYNSSGGILVAMNSEEMTQLENTYKVAVRHGIESRILSKEEIISMESNISSNVFGGIFLASECFVNPRKVTKALSEYFEKMGGKIYEKSKVTSLLEDEKGTTVGINVSDKKNFC